MLFTSILPLISKTAAEFAWRLGVKVGQIALGAARDAVVGASNATASAAKEAWQSAKDTTEAAAGKVGELQNWIAKAKTVVLPESAEFKKNQAIREYNALLGTTGTDTPEKGVCMPCLAASKGLRRQERQELMRAAQNKAVGDPVSGGRIWAATNRLAGDMDRVEDARLAQHTYTANEMAPQASFLKALGKSAPPGFS